MKILTLGNGFIASHLPYPKILDRLTANHNHVRSILEKYKPDVLINAIGYCGSPNIDACESNKRKTYLTNVTIPSILASECEKLRIHLIHLGSGCIYFGQSPNVTQTSFGTLDLGWKETDFANPKSFYSKTKYACDLLFGEDAFKTILRLRMPVSPKNDQRNFINKIRGYSKVIDIPNSMTMVEDLVKCVDWAAKNSKFGIFHVTNPEPITAAQVMREYQKYDSTHKFEVISEDELHSITIAKRSNCILNTDKLNKAGFYMTPSKIALKQCVKLFMENNGK